MIVVGDRKTRENIRSRHLLPNTEMKSSTKFAIFRNKDDSGTIDYCKEIIVSLQKEIPNSEFYSEENGSQIGVSKVFDEKEDIDYVVVVGGDGTMSHTVSRFTTKSTPPIFGVGKGTSFILYNYKFGQLNSILPHFIEKVKNDNVTVDNVIRLKMTVISLSYRRRISRRGTRPSLRMLQCRR